MPRVKISDLRAEIAKKDLLIARLNEYHRRQAALFNVIDAENKHLRAENALLRRQITRLREYRGRQAAIFDALWPLPTRIIKTRSYVSLLKYLKDMFYYCVKTRPEVDP